MPVLLVYVCPFCYPRCTTLRWTSAVKLYVTRREKGRIGRLHPIVGVRKLVRRIKGTIFFVRKRKKRFFLEKIPPQAPWKCVKLKRRFGAKYSKMITRREVSGKRSEWQVSVGVPLWPFCLRCFLRRLGCALSEVCTGFPNVDFFRRMGKNKIVTPKPSLLAGKRLCLQGGRPTV